jgi:hypothetical protein
MLDVFMVLVTARVIVEAKVKAWTKGGAVRTGSFGGSNGIHTPV